MIEDEIKKLTPHDKYILCIDDLNNNYVCARGAYHLGEFEIEFKNTKFVDYYLTDINKRRNKLKYDYEFTLRLRAKVDVQSLGEIEKIVFEKHKLLFIKIKELLTEMDKFLSQHNIELTT